MNENPYEPSATPSEVARSSTPFNVVNIAALILGVSLIVLLLLPLGRGGVAREAARQNGCQNNLRHIAIALNDYAAQNGEFPPAYTVDADGNRLHSWRTLILPYIEEKKLYEHIDLTVPWDHPTNAAVREAQLAVYICPSATHENCLTTYMAVVGADCVFSGSTPHKLSEITDGADKTTLLVDVSSDQAVHWMSPYDATEDMVLRIVADSEGNHRGAMTTSFVDARTTSFSRLERDELRAMLTIAGSDSETDPMNLDN